MVAQLAYWPKQQSFSGVSTPAIDKLAQSVRQLARTLFLASVLIFGLSFASALFLPFMGMYIALGLLFVGSFTMLLASVLRERVKNRNRIFHVVGKESESKTHVATAAN